LSNNFSNIDDIFHLAGKADDLKGAYVISDYHSINFELNKNHLICFSPPHQWLIEITGEKLTSCTI